MVTVVEGGGERGVLKTCGDKGRGGNGRGGGNFTASTKGFILSIFSIPLKSFNISYDYSSIFCFNSSLVNGFFISMFSLL